MYGYDRKRGKPQAAFNLAWKLWRDAAKGASVEELEDTLNEHPVRISAIARRELRQVATGRKAHADKLLAVRIRGIRISHGSGRGLKT